MTTLALLGIAAAAGIVTVAIHVTGARGPALPMLDLPVIGGGLYRHVWPLDTLAHGIAGVAIGATAYAALVALAVHPLITHGTVLVVLIATSIMWELYEVVFWGEIDSSGGERRWFEDTQADVLAVVIGGMSVGGLAALGVIA